MVITHEDVYLDYFKFRQNVIKKLRSGMVLSVQDNLLYFNNQETQIPVICFSKAFKNKLLNWKAKGYLPISAHVQFIVSWKGEKDDKESYIILPIIRLKRSSKT